MRGAVAESLFRRGWIPEAPRCAVLIVHGVVEHSGRYEHVGTWLAERGIAAHAYDHLGHGRSSGTRCHVESFDDYLDDLEHVLAQVREDAAGLPIFLLGHSMGGLVVATEARERRPDVAGIILTNPPLGADGKRRSRNWLARALRVFAPRLAMSTGLDPDGLSSDPGVVEAYLADPLVERRATVSLAVEIFDAVARTGPGGADIALPLLLLHGEEDPICAARFSEEFANATPRGRFIAYPGLRHEILNEPDREKVLEQIASFMDATLDRAAG